ncbi:hypothetical protein HYFRA_00000241 [Hymenoscyphus fraxineus]|uniref:Uncharacterized protein n=1 Tax=Hymenoscyphus fraxineus TaxID=746836 RepID=A0A9N9L3G9_9HELO|nr:hypothetical protein HYFRA_00000241 [Hymenoscyphus fraxineus]
MTIRLSIHLQFPSLDSLPSSRGLAGSLQLPPSRLHLWTPPSIPPYPLYLPTHTNSSTPQLLNSSTPQLLNSSTPQLLNSSTPQSFNSSTTSTTLRQSPFSALSILVHRFLNTCDPLPSSLLLIWPFPSAVSEAGPARIPSSSIKLRCFHTSLDLLFCTPRSSGSSPCFLRRRLNADHHVHVLLIATRSGVPFSYCNSAQPSNLDLGALQSDLFSHLIHLLLSATA